MMRRNQLVSGNCILKHFRPVGFFKCIVLICLSILFFSSCESDSLIIDIEKSGYPDEVGKIILTKCAVKGCHNNLSKQGASGLSLETWDDLFKGTNNGPAVIPYSHLQSTLFLYTNTYSDLGITSKPTMPINADPLTRDEVVLLRDWISWGAPNKSGFVKFSDDASRKKMYVVNQGCDAVTVFDAQSGLPMRYIPVGHSPLNESPHSIRVSPDGMYWYVSFVNGEYLQKYRCSDDAFVGEIQLGFGSWNTFAITRDGRNAFAADLSGGSIFYLDLLNMTVVKRYAGSGLFLNPHGTALSADNKILYATAQYGNYIYKLDVSNPLFPNISEITLDGSSQIITAPNVLDPHEIIFSPDFSKYFVTCQHSNQVRIFKAANDSLIGIVTTGSKPQEMAVSKKIPLLFVSCTEDTISFLGKRGAIAVINFNSNVLVKTVFSGWQPHGLAVDEDKNLVYIANRNVSPDGPAPHHSSSASGRNGNVAVLDIASLSVFYRTTEVSVDPYSVAYRK